MMSAPVEITRRVAGDIRYRLKTPYRDGTTHVIFQPPGFDGAHPCAPPLGRPSVVPIMVLPICLARLAALVPRPRVNLIRYYGVFAPNSRIRVRVTPARRGKGGAAAGGDPAVAAKEGEDGATPVQRMR